MPQPPAAATSATSARPRCCHCGAPMRPGEPHWAGDLEGRPWHYGCAERMGLTFSWAAVRMSRGGASDQPF